MISGTLTTAGAFSVTVTVSDGDLDDEASFAWNVTAPADTTPPPPPTNLTTSVSTVAVNLSWTASAEAGVTYRVYRSANGGALTELTAAPITATTFTDATAPTQVSLEYEVTAVDAAGNASDPDTASAQRDIWFRGNATAQNGAKTASITIPRPTGAQTGDLVVTIIDVRGAATVTPPAGWTLAQENTSGNAVRQVTYYRIASASEPASTVWTLSSKQGASAVSAAYGGVHTEQPLDASGGLAASSSAQITAPSVTTTADGALLIGAFGIASNPTIAAPQGMIAHGYASMNSGQNKVATQLADGLLGAAGTTGSRLPSQAGAAPTSVRPSPSGRAPP